MVRYRKSIRSGVVRIPEEVREAFGDEIELLPNFRAMAVYPVGANKKVVIKSLQLIVQDLRNELAEEG